MVKLSLFLLCSLQTMAKLVRYDNNSPKKIISHHSLIKLLIVDALSQRGRTWEAFVSYKDPHIIAENEMEGTIIMEIDPLEDDEVGPVHLEIEERE